MIIWLSVVLNRTVVAVADPDPRLRGGGGGGKGRPPGPPPPPPPRAGLLGPFLKSTTVLTVETLTSRFDQFTANDKLRFAVNGFTLHICPYLGLKIRRW